MNIIEHTITWNDGQPTLDKKGKEVSRHYLSVEDYEITVTALVVGYCSSWAPREHWKPKLAYFNPDDDLVLEVIDEECGSTFVNEITRKIIIGKKYLKDFIKFIEKESKNAKKRKRC